MTAAATPESTGHRAQVRRLSVNVDVPRDHPAPERLRQRVDEVARGPLARAVETLLEPLAASGSDEVVLIRRLRIDLDLDLGRDPELLARRWAARLLSGLLTALSSGESTGLVRFADPESQLARYLVERAAGVTGRWYQRQFEGLAALPVPVALRTALLARPLHGLRALLGLSEPEQVQVVQALGEPEARRLLLTLALPAAAEPVSTELLVALAGALAEAPLVPAAGPWSSAALLLLGAARRCPEAGWPQLARLTPALALWDRPAASGAQVTGSPAAAEEAPPSLGPLSVLSPPQRETLLQVVERRRPEQERHELATLHSALGGLVLLLPHLPAELALLPGGARGAAMARLLVLARCAGADEPRVLGDALLRRLCGLSEGERREPALDLAELAPLLCALAAPQPAAQTVPEPVEEALDQLALRTLRSFARRLPGFADSSPGFLYDRFLRCSATLEVTPSGWSCRLGRPPLATLLDLTGMLRGTLRLSWLPVPLTLARG